MKLFIIILITLAIITFTHGAPTLSAKCIEPAEAGTCSLKLPRFYYDTKTGECKEFRYGGCRGNNNRFGTKEFCEKECIKSSTSVTTPTPTQNNKKNTPTTTPTLTNKQNTPVIVPNPGNNKNTKVTGPTQDNKKNVPVATPIPTVNKNNSPAITPIPTESKNNSPVITPTPESNKNTIVNSPTPKKKVTFA